MIPFEYLIWDAEDCAQYFRQSKEHFLRHTRHSEGFPSPVSRDDQRPRWRAKSVAEWAVMETT